MGEPIPALGYGAEGDTSPGFHQHLDIRISRERAALVSGQKPTSDKDAGQVPERDANNDGGHDDALSKE
jgi:hypothetical protein